MPAVIAAFEIGPFIQNPGGKRVTYRSRLLNLSQQPNKISSFSLAAIHPHPTLPIDTLGMALHSARIVPHRRLRSGLALAGPEAAMDGQGLAGLASRYKRCALLLCTLNIVHHAGTPGRLGETSNRGFETALNGRAN